MSVMENEARIAQALNDGGCIARVRHYKERKGADLPAPKTILQRLGVRRWEDVAAYFGLAVRSPRPGRGALRCNQWVAEERLDRGRSVSELTCEYLSRHAAETGFRPSDPQRSIRSAVLNERKRRGLQG